MTREPLAVGADMSLPAAIALMQQSRYGCLSVIENGTLVGVLTCSDLVDGLQRLLAGQELNRYPENT